MHTWVGKQALHASDLSVSTIRSCTEDALVYIKYMLCLILNKV